MKLLNKLPIVTKVTSAIVFLGLITAVATAWLSFKNSSESLQSEIGHKLEAVASSRADALELLFKSIESDVLTQAQNPAMRYALIDFTFAWRELGAGQTETLKDLYINNNPFPTGQKDKLMAADDGSAYSEAHKEFHPYIKGFLDDYGYYDVFLFDTQGNLVYSVFKEADYATNFITGEWAATALGKAFRGSINSPAHTPTFFDFEPYGPSADAPASFISAPVKNETGETLGVLAFQLPVGRINALMSNEAGLGETGDAFIIGQDKLLRSDSRFDNSSSILAHRVDLPFVNTLSPEGATDIILDERGVEVIASAQSIDVFGAKWLVMAKQNTAEALKPINDLKRDIAIQLGIAALLLALLGYFISRGISQPITRLAGSMNKLQNGDTKSAIPYAERGDEIGKMSKSLTSFRDDLDGAVEANRVSLFKGAAFDGSTTPMLIVDRDFMVTFVRRHIKWHRFRPGLRETLLTSLVDIKRRLYGIASVDVR